MENFYYTDSHAHLPKDSDIKVSLPKQITHIYLNATDQHSWKKILTLSEKDMSFIPYLGLHPWFIESRSKDWLRKLKHLVIATSSGIGEIGLDKTCSIGMATQKEIFISQLQLAHELNRPVSIHCVKSWGLLLDILEKLHKSKQLPPAMIHSYNGSLESMKRLISLGCFLSFSKNLFHVENTKLKKIYTSTPINNIMLETDEPVGTMKAFSLLKKLYALGAELKELNLKDFCQRINNNGKVFSNY